MLRPTSKPNNNNNQKYYEKGTRGFALRIGTLPPAKAKRLTLPSMRYGRSPLVSLNSLIRSASNAYPRGVTELSHRHTAKSGPSVNEQSDACMYDNIGKSLSTGVCFDFDTAAHFVTKKGFVRLRNQRTLVRHARWV